MPDSGRSNPGRLPANRSRAVKPGARIDVPEHGYCFGSGHLWMVVEEVGPPFRWRDGAWWQQVAGVTVHWDGSLRGVRTAQVRLDAVAVLKIPEPRTET